VPDDKYPRVIVDELLPVIQKQYNISPDPEQHGIGGASSGAIAAFTVAWERPKQFHKVLSIVGSFVNLKGGHIYPEKVLASRRDFVALYPNTARALIQTMLEACRWLDDPAHRADISMRLAAPELLGVPQELIAPRLLGDYGDYDAARFPGQALPRPASFFDKGAVNYPRPSDGLWFLTQYRRWGLLSGDHDGDSRRLTVDIVSKRRFYGRLAAISRENHQLMPQELVILEDYGRLAAAALDSATALDETRTLL